MALKLSLSGGSGGRSTRTLSSGTLSIGRGERNDWVLPDPDRHLSKTHCVLSVENGQYILTDLSTNGVSINGARTPTTRDSRVVLTDGDEFRIGEYTIVLEETSGAGSSHASTGGSQGFGGNPGFGEDEDPLAIDPLADPLGRPRDESFSHPVRHTPQMGRTGRDPFDMQDESKHRDVVSDEDMFAGKKPDQEWSGPSQADNADANRHAMIRGRVSAPPKSSDVDFDALIGDMSSFLGPGTPPAAPAQRAPRPTAAARPASRPPADPFGSFDDLMAPPPAAAPPPPPRPAPPQPAAYAPAPAPEHDPLFHPAPPQAAPPQAPRHNPRAPGPPAPTPGRPASRPRRTASRT